MGHILYSAPARAVFVQEIQYEEISLTRREKLGCVINSTEQAAPLEENLFEWHFTVRGPGDTDFQVCPSLLISFAFAETPFLHGFTHRVTGWCLPWSHSCPCRLSNEAARYNRAHTKWQVSNQPYLLHSISPLALQV